MAINRDKILKGAEKLVQKGKIEPAIREYEKLLKLNPNDVNTINRIGDLHNRIGQVDRAVELYERIAGSFSADGFANKAIAIYKKINRLAPDRVAVFERLAELYIQQGLVVEAKDQFAVLADWYLKNDDLDNAIQIQRKLIQIDPENHMGHLRLGDLLFRKGSGDEAIDVYQRLGTMLLDRGKIEEAERLYRHALEQNPPSGVFLMPICEALVDSGKLNEAREFLIEAQKRSPDSTSIGILALKVALAAGESKAALDQAEDLMRACPDDGEVACLAGRAFLGVGAVDRGRDLLLPIATKRLDESDRAGAEEIFRWLVKVLPDDRDVLKLGIGALSSTEDKEMILTLKTALGDSSFQGGAQEDDLRVVQDGLSELGVDGAGTDQTASPSTTIDTPQPHEAPKPMPVGDVLDEDILEIDADDFEMIEVVDPDAKLDSGEIAVQGIDESLGDVPDFDPLERLAEANVFAKYGLVDKALNHLETIIHFFPKNQEVREKLVSLALDAGRTDLAAREVGPLVEVFKAEGNEEALERLERALPGLLGPEADVLSVDAGEVPAEEAVQVEFVEEVEVEALEIDQSLDFSQMPVVDDFEVAAASAERVEEIEVVEEVESIELEKVDIGRFKSRDPVTVEHGIEFEAVDEVELLGGGGDEPAAEIIEPQAVSGSRSSVEIDVLDELERTVLGGGPLIDVSTPDHEVVVQAEGTSVDDILDEAAGRIPGPSSSDLQQIDSFLENSLYEDATRLLRRMEAEHPESSEVAERRLDLKAKGFLLEQVPQVAEASADLFVDEEEAYVDLAAELEEEMAAEEAIVEKAAGPGEGEVDLEDVFREFQKGVAEQLSEEDADTHFNLGIAYKEMSLLPEAIREFQIASKDSAFYIECCSMVGVCYVEQGLWDQAAGWYQRALEAPGLADQSILALKYELANCLEGSGDYGGAAEFFEEILLEDPTFRDISSRVDGLADHLQAN